MSNLRKWLFRRWWDITNGVGPKPMSGNIVWGAGLFAGILVGSFLVVTPIRLSSEELLARVERTLRVQSLWFLAHAEKQRIEEERRHKLESRVARLEKQPQKRQSRRGRRE